MLVKNNTNNNVLFTFFSIVLFTMSLSIVSVNAGINIRIGQLMILTFFAYVILYDLKEKKLNEMLLIFFIFFAILLALVSKNSSFSKIGEMKFIIKYLLIFPAAFYIGQWIVQNIKIQKLVEAIEIALYIYIFMAFLLSIYPVSFLYHDRGALSGFQGTFLESGLFALFITSFTIASLLIRLDYKLKFTNYQYILYFLSIISLVLSKNKTVWMSLIVIMIILMLFKSFFANAQNVKDSIKKLKNINAFSFIMSLVIFTLLFFVINTLLSEPIVSVAMLEEKLKDERGKAYLAAVELLRNSDWLGGYGFGFIQQYFSVYTDEIIGLNSDSGMLFNSYLDVWISVGIIGLIYHLTLLGFALSRTHLFTIVIPVYWFISANTNPTIGDEYYYLFLGISYGFVLKNKKEEFIK